MVCRHDLSVGPKSDRAKDAGLKCLLSTPLRNDPWVWVAI